MIFSSCIYLPSICEVLNFFGEISIKVFCLFFNWGICFLFQFCEFFIYSKFQSLIRYMFYKYGPKEKNRKKSRWRKKPTIWLLTDNLHLWIHRMWKSPIGCPLGATSSMMEGSIFHPLPYLLFNFKNVSSAEQHDTLNCRWSQGSVFMHVKWHLATALLSAISSKRWLSPTSFSPPVA